jgi:hypothetical protein
VPDPSYTTCNGPYCQEPIAQPSTGRPRLYHCDRCRSAAAAIRRRETLFRAHEATHRSLVEQLRVVADAHPKPDDVRDVLLRLLRHSDTHSISQVVRQALPPNSVNHTLTPAPIAEQCTIDNLT